MNTLLELRNKMKKRKPNFYRQEFDRRKRLKLKWRAPKGRHSSLRNKNRGRRKHPSMGFSSPRAVRGLTREGYKIVLIHNLAELNKIKKGEIAEFSSTLGLKKKLELLKKIKEKAMKITNIKNIPEFIKSAEEKIALKKKEAKEKTKTETKEIKKKEEKKITQEEKEKQEKEEKRRVLEKAR